MRNEIKRYFDYLYINKSINEKLIMPKLMKQQNGQYLLTVPKGVVNALGVEKGDNIEFRVNLKKGSVELIKC